MKRTIILYFIAIMLASTFGCQYFQNRGRDFTDCFKVTLDVGVIAHAGVTLGPIDIGTGIWIGYSAGIDNKAGFGIFGLFDMSFPISNLIGAVGKRYQNPLITSLSILFSPDFGKDMNERGSILFIRWKAKKLQDYFWIEARARCLMGATIGFNIIEFFDFILGWFGIDICDDDERDKKKEIYYPEFLKKKEKVE